MDLGGGAGGQVNEGPELEQIETEYINFQSISGEDKLRLLPTSWPAERLPRPTSSLLSIASVKGLVAAAGPDALVIAKTDAVRKRLLDGDAQGGVKELGATGPGGQDERVILPVPRVSQVAFSSDESCLAIAAEEGGGLAVYDCNTLLNGAKEPAFQLATEGQGVRQLLPNPNPSPESSRYFGVVTEGGRLMLADLKDRTLVKSGSGGVVLHENVSCACWSRLGKQIVAGRGDGTAVQVDQNGTVKATMPKPPQLADLPITSIYWLETFDFLTIHTPVSDMADSDSIYHLVHTAKGYGSWTFRRFSADPCPPFGLERRPANHFIQRLRDWPPDLEDMLVLASTASTDIGMFTRSKKALDPSQSITDTFTYTQPPDSRRPAMPMGGGGDDTSPIGMAFDMSVKEKSHMPIPNDDEMDDSPIPLPALYVLNNEGTLNMWYVVYNDALRGRTMYPDLIEAGGPRPMGEQKKEGSAAPSLAPPARAGSSTSPLGAFGSAGSVPAQPSAFGKTAFGMPSAPGASNTSTTSAFGGTSALGGRPSPWGGAGAGAVATGRGATFGQAGGGATFGQPGGGAQFGKPGGGSAFGQAAAMGANKSSVWGTPSTQASSPPSRGGIFGGNTSAASPFSVVGNKGGEAPAASPFARVAPGGGSKENQPTLFGKPSLPGDPSGSTISFNTGSTVSSFGGGSTIFGGTPSHNGGSGVFGGPSATPQGKDDSMEDDTPTAKPAEKEKQENPFGLSSGGFKLGSTFKGDGTAKDDLPKPKDPGAGFFGSGLENALDNKQSNGAEQSTTPIKKEPGADEVALKDIPEATSLTSREATPKPKEEKKAPVDDAPLPPDFTTWKPKPGALPPPIPPGFGADFGKPKTPEKNEEAPLPAVPQDTPAPSTLTNDDSIVSSDGPVAGSPPVDLGSERFSETADSETAGPPDDDDDFSGEEDGEIEDESENLQETPEVTQTQATASFSFTPASPNRSEQQSVTPATDKKDSYTPAGLPKAPVMFQPPTKHVHGSPRSPSPVRSATSPLRLPAQTFASQQAKKPSQKPTPGRPTPGSIRKLSRQPSQPQRIAVPPGQLVQTQKAAPPPEPEEPDSGELEDEEDARVKEILAAPMEPSTEVPAFLAHQDYVSAPHGAQVGDEKPGLGGQIEKVYRDVNSMIDTLALNARSIQGFVEGNRERHDEIGDQALDQPEAWLLGDAPKLATLMETLGDELEEGRQERVHELLEQLEDEETETTRLRAKSGDLRKALVARSDPDAVASSAAAPLPIETAALQAELRQDVLRVQKLLAKAEEQLSVLRAELASLPSSPDGQNGKGSAVPTVEAVTNTILKMTAMVERKSGDIDVLELQIRRLGGPAALQPLSRQYEDELVNGLKNSRLSASRSPVALRLRETPRSARHGTPGAYGTPSARKSLFDVEDAELEAYRAKKEGRRRAVNALREVVESRGPRVVKVNGA